MGKSARNKAAKRNARVRAQARSVKSQKRSGPKTGHPASRAAAASAAERAAEEAVRRRTEAARLARAQEDDSNATVTPEPVPGWTPSPRGSKDRPFRRATALIMAALVAFALIASMLASFSTTTPEPVVPQTPVFPEQTFTPQDPGTPKAPEGRPKTPKGTKKTSGPITPPSPAPKKP